MNYKLNIIVNFRQSKGIHLAFLALALLTSLVSGQKNDLDFTPNVVASCSEFPYMKITVFFNQNFNGVVHTVDHRQSDACRVFGNGDHNVTLVLRVTSEPNAVDDCGVRQNELTDQRSVSIFVRYHKTLERSEDKPFTITCDDPSYMNSRSENSTISMQFLEDGQRTKEVVQGRQYILRVQESHPDAKFHFKVKKCYSTGSSNPETVPLTDDRGCPLDPNILSRFRYNSEKGTSEAIIFSMFKFPGSRMVGITCLVAVCRGFCVEESCDGPPQVSSRVDDNVPQQLWTSESALIVDPSPLHSLPLVDCTVWRFPWLIGLCIAFGILFVIMLIVNILLCSALTCSCAKQEVIERDPSVIEDYDPYKTGPSWGSGSQYGSRYSLNGKHEYPSGGSTLNSTTRSFSTNSDHYAVVHNHPGNSRYHGDDRSSKGGFSHHHGPESTISAGNHSGRM